jgi:ankyrin repeat protein
MRNKRKLIILTLLCVLVAVVTCYALIKMKSGEDHMESNIYFRGIQLELAQAIGRDNIDGIRSALSKGADVNALGAQGITPAMYAVAKIKKNAVAFLIEAGANLSIRAVDDNSAITLAMKLVKRDPDWLRLIFEIGKSDPNTKMPNGGPILEYFIATDNASAIKYLVAKGADPNTLSRSKRPLILDTAYAGRYELVELLLQLGATANIPELRELVAERSMLDTAPGSPEWNDRERVRKLLSTYKKVEK